MGTPSSFPDSSAIPSRFMPTRLPGSYAYVVDIRGMSIWIAHDFTSCNVRKIRRQLFHATRRFGSLAAFRVSAPLSGLFVRRARCLLVRKSALNHTAKKEKLTLY